MEYCLPVTCPGCGADVRHVNGTPPDRPAGPHVVAIVECVATDACGAQWLVDVKMSRHAVPKTAAAKVG